MKPVDIFVTAYLRREFTLQTIKYLKERTKTPYRLFLINNGGNDIEDESIFLRIDMNHNVGIHAAWNMALAFAESDYFITTDNDILCPDLEPDWLSQMIKFMDDRPDYGAISLCPHIFIGAAGIDPTDPEDVKERNMCGAVARVMRREAVVKAGGWEHVIRTSRNHEESTICSRLQSNGYKTGIATRIRAFHLFGDGTNSDSWGYPKEMTPEQHGHHGGIWPPPEAYGDKTKYDQKTWIAL